MMRYVKVNCKQYKSHLPKEGSLFASKALKTPNQWLPGIEGRGKGWIGGAQESPYIFVQSRRLYKTQSEPW